jgi:hypothetical protein
LEDVKSSAFNFCFTLDEGLLVIMRVGFEKYVTRFEEATGNK